MSHSVADKLGNAFKFIYHGVIDGLLLTSCPIIFIHYYLLWTITPVILSIFIAASVLTVLASIYYRFFEHSRISQLNALNSQANDIMTLVAELQYYKEKLIVEQQLLIANVEEGASKQGVINRTVSFDNRKKIKQKIKKLQALLGDDSPSGLKAHVEAATTFKQRFYWRHAVGIYKSINKGIVFFIYFPVFGMLAVTLLLSPGWLPATLIQFYTACAFSFLLGFIKSYLKERNKIREFDVAIQDITHIRDSATAVADSLSKHHQRDPVILRDLPPIRSIRAKEGQRIKLYLKIKKDAKLLKRIPLLSSLPKTLGHLDFSDSLHLERLGRYLFAAYSGALLPAGVALFLQFVLGVTFLHPVNISFVSLMLPIAVISVLYQVYNDYRNAIRLTLENQMDRVYRLSIQAQYILQKHKKEKVLLSLPGNEQNPFHRSLSASQQKMSRKVVQNFKDEAEKLEQNLEKAENYQNNLLTRLMRGLFGNFHVINVSVVLHFFLEILYYGLVFLIAWLFVDIMAISTLNLTILTLVAYMFGQEVTVIVETQFNAMTGFQKKLEDARSLGGVANELTRHCDKYLAGNAKLRENIVHTKAYLPQADKPEISINPSSKKFELLNALRHPNRKIEAGNLKDSDFSNATDHEDSVDGRNYTETVDLTL